MLLIRKMADADSITKPFTLSGEYGYSCQTLLAKRVNEFLHNGAYFCWFSLEFNPSVWGNSSNPLWLYQTLSHSLRTGDVNDAKVQQIRTALLEAVTRNSPLEGTPEVAAAIVHIRNAPIDLFRPQLWQIKIKQISARVMGGHQYPHERKVEDLTCLEFNIIVE